MTKLSLEEVEELCCPRLNAVRIELIKLRDWLEELSEYGYKVQGIINWVNAIIEFAGEVVDAWVDAIKRKYEREAETD